MKALALAAALGVLAGFAPVFPVQAQEMSKEGCTQRIVDFQRDCGAIVGQQSLFRLEKPGDCATIEINAESRWNASGILFEKGVAYHIEVVGGNDATWCDATIEATAEGWYKRSRPKIDCIQCKQPYNECTQTKGPTDPLTTFEEWIFGLMEPLRRSPSHDWFYLMGSVGAENEPDPFPVGVGTTIKPIVEGEFCSFANDLSFKYGNNRGSLKLKITRESK